MKLGELLERSGISAVCHDPELEISNITERASDANESTVFVCIHGARFDGNDFFHDARQRDCRVFVSSKKTSRSSDETWIYSENPRKTLAELCKALWYSCFENMKIIGITGTKGKTTTGKMLFELLKFENIPSVLIGTLGAEGYGIDVPHFSLQNTTPRTDIIYKILAYAGRGGATAAVIEVSSQALDNYRVFGIPFTVCVFTNLSPDHIGRYEHTSYEAYREAKLSLFRHYGAECAIVNRDDCSSPFFIDAAHGCSAKVVTVSCKDNADFLFSVKRSDAVKTEFTLNGYDLEIPMGGGFNALNAALAIAAASQISDKPASALGASLSSLRVRGRYEVYDYRGAKIIIDFAHNEESIRTICKDVKKLARGRLILLFGSVGGRSQSRRRALASVAEKYADFSVITADNPAFEAPEDICREIYSNFKDKSKAVVITDREQAIKSALLLVKPEDFLLLLGKGHEEYQEVGSQKIPFSERAVILSLGAVPAYSEEYRKN